MINKRIIILFVLGIISLIISLFFVQSMHIYRIVLLVFSMATSSFCIYYLLRYASKIKNNLRTKTNIFSIIFVIFLLISISVILHFFLSRAVNW